MFKLFMLNWEKNCPTWFLPICQAFKQNIHNTRTLAHMIQRTKNQNHWNIPLFFYYCLIFSNMFLIWSSGIHRFARFYYFIIVYIGLYSTKTCNGKISQYYFFIRPTVVCLSRCLWISKQGLSPGCPNKF